MSDNTEIINQLLHQREEKTERIAALQRDVQQIEKALAALGVVTSYVEWTKDAYKCIEEFEKFVQTSQILNCLFAESPEELEDERKKRNYTVALSLALNKMVQSGRLRKVVMNGVKGHFYGLPMWTDQLGTPLSEYTDGKLKEALEKPPVSRVF